MMEPQPRSNWIAVLIVSVSLALAIALGSLQLMSPTALPLTAPEDEFSAGRACHAAYSENAGRAALDRF